MGIVGLNKLNFKAIFPWLVLFSYIIVFSVGTLGQRQEAKTKLKRYGRIDVNKPTLYISFLSAETEKDKKAVDQKERAYRLRLHNNTYWTIYYYIALEDNKAIGPTMIYDVEDKEGNSVYRFPVGHVLFQQNLLPGKKVSFDVKEEYLMKGRRLYVEYNYEWESRKGEASYSTEPNHRVYFYHYNLPDYLRGK